ncbi:glycosyltransferase family 2 protein [Devosia nitrariae]|uniref:Glycosyltransferase 2-like domain-containing protein n=1 Tax=Devosia nitrariae TaxID=2071872 RepID=A0ABQ5W0U1_9HYPH|nr:glycosyltransferase family A protein [Devosia nitrariae]GLQ53672.1 hypothetical protein GCM10010862_09310 [Devosia nitrariae]
MKSREKLISVVIPAYNAERFLERTLRSAAAQTYSPIEIIVIDDGSTDTTRDIALRFAEADARVKVINVANGGVARARNIGIERSRGDYVAFLDADDLWHPTKIALQVATLEAADDPSWAACYTLFRSIDTDDFTQRPGPSRYRSGYILAQLLFAKFVGNGSSLLVRRSAALAVGGFDPSYADAGIGGSEDLDFELRLAARYRIAAVPQFLVGYRRYVGNMSSSQLRMSRAVVETVRRCLAANPDLPKAAGRYALATTHNWAGGFNLWREGGAALSLAHKMTAFRNDPLLTAFRIYHWLGRRWHAVTAAVAPRAPAGPRKYLDVSPLDGLELRPSRYHELRLRQLARIDAERERRLFSSKPSTSTVTRPEEQVNSSEPAASMS